MLSRRKQGFESPRERQGFQFFSRRWSRTNWGMGIFWEVCGAPAARARRPAARNELRRGDSITRPCIRRSQSSRFSEAVAGAMSREVSAMSVPQPDAGHAGR